MKLEKEQQIKPKLSRKKKMINIIAAINGTDNRRTIEKIKETKSRLFKRMMKMITPQEGLSRIKEKKTQMTNIRSEILFYFYKSLENAM